jgi:NSS family neurotransmitter:Na+ symporter
VKLFGLTFFDLFDYISSNLLLPLGGLFLAIFAGWFWGYPRMQAALSNEGKLHNQVLVRFTFNVVRFVTPVLVVIVLLRGIGVF